MVCRIKNKFLLPESQVPDGSRIHAYACMCICMCLWGGAVVLVVGMRLTFSDVICALIVFV